MVMSKKNQNKQGKREWWALKVSVLTFILAMLISLFAEVSLPGASLAAALALLLVLVAIGIAADILGIAVTAVTLAPFTAMAAKRIRGAAESIRLVKHADRVANICNDVIGDICGIVSGAAGAAIALRLTLSPEAPKFLPAIIVSSLIAAVTVSGKALGKRVALDNCRRIVFFAGQVISLFHRQRGEKDE